MSRRREPKRLQKRVFRYDGLSIGVSCDNAKDLEWLEEFLSPSFRVLKRGSHDYSVGLRRDRELWDTVRSWGPHPHGKSLDCYYLDTKTARHPVWRGPDDVEIVSDDEFDVFYIVDSSEAKITILSAKDRWMARLSIMRVVRELAMIHSQREDRMIVHGSGFMMGRRGFVIAGHKRSGKTSLLIHSLRGSGARYVANDRTLVKLDQDGARLYGMPSIVTLRPSSLKMFPRLNRQLRSRNYYPALSLSEARRGIMGRIKPWRNGKLNISPAQLCALLRVEPAAPGTLSAILFPEITGKRGAIRFRELSRETAAARLRGSLFRYRSPVKFGGLFAELSGAKNPSRRVVEQFTRRLAATVPCFVCELGLDAYRQGH